MQVPCKDKIMGSSPILGSTIERKVRFVMNQYWRLAKIAFVFGAASAAGGIVVKTVYRLAKKTGQILSDDHESIDYEGEDAEESSAESKSI